MESLSQLLIPVFSEGASLLILWSWQAFLLLGLVWLMLWIGRVRTPGVRHRIWLFGLLAIAALPSLSPVANKFAPLPTNKTISTFVVMPRTVTASHASADAVIQETPAPQNAVVTGFASFSWQTLVLSALFAAWMVGFLVALTRFIRTYFRFQRITKRSKAVTAAELGCDDSRLRAFNYSYSLIRLSSDVSTPMLTGLCRPVILLPADIVEWTTAEERTAMLQHEMAHISRRDHYTNFLQSLLRSVFFFHPLFRYVCNQLYLERELACDAWVLHAG